MMEGVEETFSTKLNTTVARACTMVISDFKFCREKKSKVHLKSPLPQVPRCLLKCSLTSTSIGVWIVLKGGAYCKNQDSATFPFWSYSIILPLLLQLSLSLQAWTQASLALIFVLALQNSDLYMLARKIVKQPIGNFAQSTHSAAVGNCWSIVWWYGNIFEVVLH